jgi:cation diffusion facilitator family transporter
MTMHRSREEGGGEQSRTRQILRVTWVGLFANLGLSGLKFAGGILGGSQAVVADAVHSLSDITTDMAIILGVRYWTKPADDGHPHGHRQVEAVVTLSIGIVLAVVATGLLWNAVVNLHEKEETSPGWIAFAAALASILCKEVLYRWTAAAGRRIRSMPLVANAWHHRSDAFSSIPVVVAVAGAALEPSWAFLDHVGAAAVSLFIYQAALKIVWPTLGKLIDSGAPEEDLNRIRMLAGEVKGVKDVHGLRTRYLGCSGLAVDLHIEVDGAMTVRKGHDISEEVKRRLLEKGPEVLDVVVHLEPNVTDR